MKFRTKIYLIFILSILITLLSTTSFVFNLLQQYNALYENDRLEKALTEILTVMRKAPFGENQELELLLRENLGVVNREYVQGKVLKKDLVVSGITSLFIFLSSQALLLFALGFFVIRALTSQLNLIYTGLQEVARRGHAFRFPALKGQEFKTIGNELNRMLEKLAAGEAVMREQAQLAGWQEVSSFLSHQLKNPLTAISLAARNLELCGAQANREELITTSTRIISEESYRLKELIARLRRLSAFPEPTPEPVDLAELLQEVAGRFAPEQLEFRCQCPPLPPLQVDRQLMEQAFLNLLSNSCEAVGGKAVVQVTVTRLAGEILFTLSDSVTALKPDILQKIFVPKFTTKKNGMGLGLTFTRKILRLHGGDLHAALTAAGGLMFTLTLPSESANV